MLLEELAEGGVADAQFQRYLLNGECVFERLSDALSRLVDDVHVLGVLAQDDVALQGVHLSDEVVHDARHGLLGVGCLLLGRLIGLFVEADDLVAEPYVVDGFFGREESGLHPVVDVPSLESYPVAFPSLVVEGMVAVPFSREEEKHIAGFDLGLGDMGGVEDALTLGLVEELVFVERASFLQVEEIAVGVPLGGIVVTGGDIFSSHSADGESPFCVSFCCQ